MAKATFTVGVFGLACLKDDDGTLRIKVNVRTDQEKQRKLAGLSEDSKVLIVDMPGGGVELADFPEPKDALLFDVLAREIKEETGGCTIRALGHFSGPFMVVTNNQDETKPTGDLAFWVPVLLCGTPQPTAEALDHPWITFQQFETETEYRAVGGLGKAGRTGRMLRDAFEFYNTHRRSSKYFSVFE